MNKKIKLELELQDIISWQNGLSKNKNQFYLWILKMMDIKKEDLLLNLEIQEQIIKEKLTKL
jgi:hypothetical protein